MCGGAGRKNRRYQDRGDIGGKCVMIMSKRNPGSAIQLQNDQALMIEQVGEVLRCQFKKEASGYGAATQSSFRQRLAPQTRWSTVPVSFHPASSLIALSQDRKFAFRKPLF